MARLQDIARIVARKLGPKLFDATLVKLTPGARIPGDMAAGTAPMTSRHTAKGIIESAEETFEAGTLTGRVAKKILLLGATIAGGAEPAVGDRIEFDGVEYAVTGVVTDPVKAHWSCAVLLA